MPTSHKHSASAAGGHTCTQPKRVGVTHALSLSRGGCGKRTNIVESKARKRSCTRWVQNELFFKSRAALSGYERDCCRLMLWHFFKMPGKKILVIVQEIHSTFFESASKFLRYGFLNPIKKIVQFINNKNFIIFWSSFVDACWAFACSMAQLRLFWETLITSISEERGPFCLFISPESFVVTLKIEALTLYWMTELF